MADVPLWWAVGGSLAGYVAAAGTEILRDIRLAKRASEERRDTRMAARDDRRDEFEREALIALQDLLPRFARHIWLIHTHNMDEYRTHGTFGRISMPDELGGEAALEIQLAMGRLESRILDDKLRADITAFRSACNDQANGTENQDDVKVKDAAERFIATVMPSTFKELNERIGARMRLLV